MARALWILGFVVLAGVALLFAGRGRDVVDLERAAGEPAPSLPRGGLARGDDAGPAAPEPSAREPSARDVERDPYAAVPEDGAFDPSAVYGRVVDWDEEPIEGARVLLFTRGELPARRLLARTTTDAGGRFRFSGFFPREDFMVYADAPEHTSAIGSTSCGHDELVWLRRTVSIRGKVFDEVTREPLGGVALWTAGEKWGTNGFVPLSRTVSAKDGSYELDGLPVRSSSRVLAQRPGCDPETIDGNAGAHGREGADIHLACTGLRALQMYDHATGEPLARRAVTVGEEEWFETDAQGMFSYPLGSVSDLFVRTPGSCETMIYTSEDDPVIRVPIVFGGALRVRVLDTSGRPVPNASIVFAGILWELWDVHPDLPEGVEVRSYQGIPVTDADGRTALEGILPRERPYRLLAFHPQRGRSAIERVAIHAAGERHAIELVLQEGATLHGVVTDRAQPKRTLVSCKGEAFHATTWTDDRGGYRFEGLPYGTYSLVDDHEEYGVEVEVYRDDVEQDLHQHAYMATIGGRVFDHLGRPVRRARVTAHPEGDDSLPLLTNATSTETRPDGSFELEGPAQGTYTLSAKHGPRSARQEDVFPGTTVELFLDAAHELVFHVLDTRTDSPVPGFEVWWREPGESEFRTKTHRSSQEDGPPSFLFAEGEVEVWVDAVGYGFCPSEILALRVGPEPEPIEVALEPGTRVTLRLIESGQFAELAVFELLDGNAVVLCSDELADPDCVAPLPPRAVTDGELVLRPGTYHFHDVSERVRVTPESFTVPAAESFEVTVRVEFVPD